VVAARRPEEAERRAAADVGRGGAGPEQVLWRDGSATIEYLLYYTLSRVVAVVAVVEDGPQIPARAEMLIGRHLERNRRVAESAAEFADA